MLKFLKGKSWEHYLVMVAVGGTLFVILMAFLSALSPHLPKPSYEPSPPPPMMPETYVPSSENELSAFLQAWESSLEGHDVVHLMSCYHPDFSNGNMDYYQYKDYMTGFFSNFNEIDVTVTNASYEELSSNRIKLTFHQTLRLLSGDGVSYNDSGYVEMILANNYGRYQVIYESWKPYY